MTILYLPIAVAVAVCSLYWYVTRTFNYWKKKGVVGPTPVPLFGNIKESALRKKFIGEVLKEIYDAYPNEKVVGIYRMTTPALMIRDLDIIKHVMIKDFDLFTDRGVEFSKEGLGMNLFHSDGETWRVLRNRFTPLFTSGKLKNMLYLMAERGDHFLTYLDKMCGEQKKVELHMSRMLQKYTMSTISACAFGLDIDTYNNDIAELEKVDKLIFNVGFVQELDFMYPGILKKLNTSLFPKFVSDYFYNLATSIIKQRNGNPSNRHDFMDLILELRKQGQIVGTKKTVEEERKILEMSDDVIAAQAFVFFAAGYDTSATTMSYFFYEMARRPNLQEKMIAEIDEVLSKHDTVTYDVLNQLDYTSRALDETLRMYPIVDPLLRNAQVDYAIPGTDIVIKKGTTLVICPSGVQYDPKNFPDPETFDPDRYTAENSADRHSCAYLPFGVGPRNCIGMRFAKLQSLMCIAKFFSKFRIEISPNTKKIQFDPKKLTSGPDQGITLNVIKR